MAIRKNMRTKAVLPVRISGKDGSGKTFERLTHSIDISRNGMCVAGLSDIVANHDLVTVQYKTRKGQFEVVWVKQNSAQQLVGLMQTKSAHSVWADILKDVDTTYDDNPRVSEERDSLSPVPASQREERLLYR